MSELVIATFNEKKGNEMRQILGQILPSVTLCTLAEFPEAEEPDETGSTYQENAAIKAVAAARATGLPSLADDAGLEIDALEGAPGLYSKRFGGEDLSFDQKIEKILELMEGVSGSERAARFRCCIVYAEPGKEELDTFEATCEGMIADSRSGGGGFGYDPIFYLPNEGCTMADLTAEQKHKISHRGKVLRAFVQFWHEQKSGH